MPLLLAGSTWEPPEVVPQKEAAKASSSSTKEVFT